MISGRNIGDGIAGTIAMARAEETWNEGFDMSAEAVFRSFWAMALALPAHLVAVEGARRITIEAAIIPVSPATPVQWGIAQSFIFLSIWAAEVALLVALARRRDMGWKVSPLIIGYNWSMFLARMALGLTMGLSMIAGLGGLAQFNMVLVAGFSVWLQWGVIRRTLETSQAGSVGVIVLLRALSVFVSLLLTGILTAAGLIPPPGPIAQ